MPIMDPSVIVESVINNGFETLLENVNAQIPLILSQFPQSYIDDAIEYLTDPAFSVQTIFQNAYDPTKLPAWNIVLSNESEATGTQHMFLNDLVDAADGDGSSAEEYGSDWDEKVNVYIRAQKERQCIILYALTKWIFLQNRLTFEAAGFQVPLFSGSDIMYEVDRKPTFVFTRMLSISCRALQTVNVPNTDTTLKTVSAEWPDTVTIESQANIGGT